MRDAASPSTVALARSRRASTRPDERSLLLRVIRDDRRSESLPPPWGKRRVLRSRPLPVALPLRLRESCFLRRFILFVRWFDIISPPCLAL
ncbi:MAG: hypothetical protein QNJ72_37495 [Pleurocapsa sp. MO_226.B13]|nr:hypothetical protein [Pleurocapsa sp. MO_226.B13]